MSKILERCLTLIKTFIVSIIALSPLWFFWICIVMSWSNWICVFKSSLVWKLTPQSGHGSFHIQVYLHYYLSEYEFSSLLLSEDLHHNLDRGLFKYWFISIMICLNMSFQVFFCLKTYTTIWTGVFSNTGLWSFWIWVFKSSFVWKLIPQSGKGSFQIFSPGKFFHFFVASSEYLNFTEL